MPGSAKFQREQALRDTQTQFARAFQQNMNQFSQAGNPALEGMIRMGVLQGQRASQDMQGALGSLGGGSSGLGAISRSFAQSFAANNAAQARAKFTMENMKMALQATQGNQQVAAAVPTEGMFGQFGKTMASMGQAMAPFIPAAGLMSGFGGGGSGQQSQFGNVGGGQAGQNQTAQFGKLVGLP